MLSNSLLSNYTMWDGRMNAPTARYRVLRYDQRGRGGTARSELIVLSEAAHLPNIEKPTAFNDALLEFLDL